MERRGWGGGYIFCNFNTPRPATRGAATHHPRATRHHPRATRPRAMLRDRNRREMGGWKEHEHRCAVFVFQVIMTTCLRAIRAGRSTVLVPPHTSRMSAVPAVGATRVKVQVYQRSCSGW